MLEKRSRSQHNLNQFSSNGSTFKPTSQVYKLVSLQPYGPTSRCNRLLYITLYPKYQNFDVDRSYWNRLFWILLF